MLKKLLAVLKRLGIRPAVAQDYLSAFPTNAGQQPKITPSSRTPNSPLPRRWPCDFAEPTAGPRRHNKEPVRSWWSPARASFSPAPKENTLTGTASSLLIPSVRSRIPTSGPLSKIMKGTCPTSTATSNVTVGIGHLVPSLGAAQAIAFVNKFTELPGTPDEIAKDFEFARTLGSALASDYEDPTILRLAAGEVDRLFDDDFIVHVAVAENFFSLDFLPHPVQIALFDLAFQTGGNLTKGKYRDLHPALERRDWARAGKEMDVNRPPTPARNAARLAKAQEALAFDFFYTTDPAKTEPLLNHLLKL